ncbi:MAG: WecB/TagA/CpsF family glycosyltransferase [Deltaproteobacteria bacterium]
MDKINMLGVPIDFVDMEDACERARMFAVGDRFRYIFTPNPEIIMLAQEDEEFKRVLISADMLVPDGIGVVWASWFYGKKLPERVPGFDIMADLIAWGASHGWKFYLLGGQPGVVDRAKMNLEKVYPNINVVGTHHGYFDENKEEEIIAHINLCSPNIILVGMGAPLQEKWIFKNRMRLNARVGIGVGGALDILAGKTKRAPAIFARFGLEWLYRLMKEPSRIKRMMVIPVFFIKVILSTKMKGFDINNTIKKKK